MWPNRKMRTMALAALTTGKRTPTQVTQDNGSWTFGGHVFRSHGDHGLAETEREHAAGDSPLADYRARGVENDRLATAIAGVTGGLVVLTLFGGLTFLLRRRAAADSREGSGQESGHR